MKKGKVIIILVSVIILAIYAAMLMDTLSVVRETKDVFYGKVDASQIADLPIRRYNITESHPDADIVKVNIIVLFTLHNFKDGYMWIQYTDETYNSKGVSVSGDSHIPARWRIHKENGKWVIIDIDEAP